MRRPVIERRVAFGLALSTGAMAASTFGTLGFAAIAPLVRDEFALSTFEIGALTALVFLGAMVASVPAGRLTDRIGAPAMLALAELGVAAGLGIAALAPSRLVFLGGVAVAGMAYGGVNPPTNVLVSDAGGRRHRGLMLSVKQTGVPLGGLVAGSLLPPVAEARGWRSALLLPIAGLLVAAAASYLLARRQMRASDPARETDTAEGVVPVPGLAAMSAYGFVMAGTQLAFVGYLTVYLVDRADFTPTQAGLALSVAFAAGVIGRPAWGIASDRYFASHATSLALAALGCFAGLVAMAASGDGPGLWVAIVLVGFCGVGWNGVYFALVADGTRRHALGRATGTSLMALYAGVVLLPPLFGLLVDALGSWPDAWLVGAAGVLAAGLAIGLAPRSVRG